MIKLNPNAHRSTLDYAAALIEACKSVRPEVQPLDALQEAAAYPRLTRIPEVEFCIGWINGVAAVSGVTVARFWDALRPLAEAQYTKVARHAKERVRR